jgi:PST family polysaccharide transporter
MTLSDSIGFSNIRWVGAIQLGQIAIQLGSVVTLARLLAPSDYGLMAMAMTFSAFAYLIRDMGAPAALIQIKVSSRDLLSTVFYLNVAWGCILGTAVVLFSHLVALAFDEPNVEFVLMALAISFPLGSLSTVPKALMERESRFREVARIEILSSVFGFGAALLAAWNGFGVYSLVLQVLTVTAVSTLLIWRVSHWRPSLTWNQAELRKVWRFGANLTANDIANYLHRNADTMLVGRFLGTTNLGWYNMAYNVMLLPVRNLSWMINRALLPVYARQDRETLGAYYSKILSLLALISAPLMCGLWAVRAPLVQAVLGDKWMPVATVLTWLLPAGFLQSLVSTAGPILLATSRTDIMRNISVYSLPLFVIGFVGGLRYGIVGIAAVYFFATLLQMIPVYYFALREIDLGIVDVISSVWRPSVVGLAMAVVVTMVDLWIVPAESQAWLRLAILIPVGVAFYLISIILLAPSLSREFKALLWPRF